MKGESSVVTQGFKLRESGDFGGTFAPTISGSFIRMFAAIAYYEKNLGVCHLDVQLAFVKSNLVGKRMFSCVCLWAAGDYLVR